LILTVDVAKKSLNPAASQICAFFSYAIYMTNVTVHSLSATRRLGENRSANGIRTEPHLYPTPERIHWRSVRTAQHEWSHNYGTHHSGEKDLLNNSGRCRSRCLMDGNNNWNDRYYAVSDVWCDRCKDVIIAKRELH